MCVTISNSCGRRCYLEIVIGWAILIFRNAANVSDPIRFLAGRNWLRNIGYVRLLRRHADEVDSTNQSAATRNTIAPRLCHSLKKVGKREEVILFPLAALVTTQLYDKTSDFEKGTTMN